MTIKEVEKKLNISRANIRFYEKEGLLEPKRCDNEYRDYSEDDLKRLEKILLFRKCNISIENIRLIFNIQLLSNRKPLFRVAFCFILFSYRRRPACLFSLFSHRPNEVLTLYCHIRVLCNEHPLFPFFPRRKGLL